MLEECCHVIKDFPVWNYFLFIPEASWMSNWVNILNEWSCAEVRLLPWFPSELRSVWILQNLVSCSCSRDMNNTAVVFRVPPVFVFIIFRLCFYKYIYKVDIENCPVYNSNVAINVPFLITELYIFFNVLLWILYTFKWVK